MTSLKTSITIPDDLAETLASIAADQERSLAAVIRSAIRSYAESRGTTLNARKLLSDLEGLYAIFQNDVAEVNRLKAEVMLEQSRLAAERQEFLGQLQEFKELYAAAHGLGASPMPQ